MLPAVFGAAEPAGKKGAVAAYGVFGNDISYRHNGTTPFMFVEKIIANHNNQINRFGTSGLLRGINGFEKNKKDEKK